MLIKLILQDAIDRRCDTFRIKVFQQLVRPACKFLELAHVILFLKDHFLKNYREGIFMRGTHKHQGIEEGVPVSDGCKKRYCRNYRLGQRQYDTEENGKFVCTVHLCRLTHAFRYRPVIVPDEEYVPAADTARYNQNNELIHHTQCLYQKIVGYQASGKHHGYNHHIYENSQSRQFPFGEGVCTHRLQEDSQ